MILALLAAMPAVAQTHWACHSQQGKMTPPHAKKSKTRHPGNILVCSAKTQPVNTLAKQNTPLPPVVQAH